MTRRDENVGYKSPPISTRFRKGQSGNPRGRPKGRRTQAPYETVLGQTVIIHEDGVERRVTAAEAFLLHMVKRGLEGDSAAARATMTAIEDARARRFKPAGPSKIIIRPLSSDGCIEDAIETLRMARVLDPYRNTARMALEPWMVEAALQRLGDQRLTPEEQDTIVKATRTPWKVKWPEWWQAKKGK